MKPLPVRNVLPGRYYTRARRCRRNYPLQRRPLRG